MGKTGEYLASRKGCLPPDHQQTGALPRAGSRRCGAGNRNLFRDLQVDGLGALAAAVRLGVVADLLIFGQSRQPGRLNGGDMDEDVRAAIVRLDETVPLVGIEKLYDASFGHASRSFSRPSAC